MFGKPLSSTLCEESQGILAVIQTGRRKETVSREKGKGNEKEEEENGVEPKSVSALAKVTKDITSESSLRRYINEETKDSITKSEGLSYLDYIRMLFPDCVF